MACKCGNEELVTISWKHVPVPLSSSMENKIKNIIDYFLLYSPLGEYSYQAEYTVESMLFDKKYIRRNDNIMKKIKKILLEKLELDNFINDSVIGQIRGFEHEGEVCLKCQEVYFEDGTKNNYVGNFMFHLRNSIAHGRFTIVKGIENNEEKSNYSGNEFFVGEDKLNRITGFYKLKVDNLYNLIQSIYKSEITKDLLLELYESKDYERTEFSEFIKLKVGSYGCEVKKGNEKIRFYLCDDIEEKLNYDIFYKNNLEENEDEGKIFIELNMDIDQEDIVGDDKSALRKILFKANYNFLHEELRFILDEKYKNHNIENKVELIVNKEGEIIGEINSKEFEEFLVDRSSLDKRLKNDIEYKDLYYEHPIFKNDDFNKLIIIGDIAIEGNEKSDVMKYIEKTYGDKEIINYTYKQFFRKLKAKEIF